MGREIGHHTRLDIMFILFLLQFKDIWIKEMKSATFSIYCKIENLQLYIQKYNVFFMNLSAHPKKLWLYSYGIYALCVCSSSIKRYYLVLIFYKETLCCLYRESFNRKLPHYNEYIAYMKKMNFFLSCLPVILYLTQ